MAPEARSYRIKFDRSQEHLKELNLRIGRWRDGCGYSARFEPDPDEPGYLAMYASVDPIPENLLSPVIGDVVQNLRASLDHLIFALSEARLGRSLSEVEAKAPKFPIIGCEDDRQTPESRFENAKGNALQFIGPKACAMVEGLQPYKVARESRGSADYTDSFLWQLHKLSNVDKHHTIQLTTAVPGGLHIGASPDSNRLYTGRFTFFPAVSVERDTKIALVPPQHGMDAAEMEMDIKPSLEVTFSKAPMVGKSVPNALGAISLYVAVGVIAPLESLLRRIG